MSNTIEAEVVQPDKPTQALTVRQTMAVGQAMGVQEIIAQVKLIQEVMRSVMTEGEHYGTIPGCGDKKTLLQPGAQKLTMTFRLAPEYQIQETDLPNGHKEYRVVCTLKSLGSGSFVGQGVGCCSTMESKYRYRGGARKCPHCGKETIIKGKAQYGGGWLCFAKKGGCGAKWPDGAQEIEGQSVERVEHENPADFYNTVLKMSKKRAFVDATITATAASDIFTQDIGDDETDGEPEKPPTKQPETSADRFSKAANTRPPAKPSEAKKTPPPLADEQTRAKMIRKLDPMLDLATEYFRTLANPTVLLPNETLEDVPLKWVPITTRQMWQLKERIKGFGNGEVAEHPYPPNPRPETAPQAQPPAAKTGDSKPKPHIEQTKAKDPEWWRDVICPVPPKGMKRDQYMKAPQTVGWMYDNRHDSEVNRRLFGFVMNFTVNKTWVNGAGQTVMRDQTRVDADTLFREALDACHDYAEKHAGDTEDHVAKEEGHSALSEPQVEADPTLEDDCPF